MSVRHDAQAAPPRGRRSMMRPLRARLLAVAALTILVACAGEFTTQSEPLRLLADRLPDAVLNEPYSEAVQAVGGLRPYSFALESGTLPPGIVLEGGSLRGRPTAAGAYEFTVSVSDANLSSTFESFTLNVITPPPPRLMLQPPETEVRGVVTLRARVSDARSLAGLMTEITWDPEQFTLVEGGIAGARQDTVLFDETTPGRVRVDLAVLASTIDGSAQVFTLALAPVAPPALLAVRSDTRFASTRGGEVLFEHHTATEGPGSLASPSATDPGPDTTEQETPEQDPQEEDAPEPDEPRQGGGSDDDGQDDGSEPATDGDAP